MGHGHYIKNETETRRGKFASQIGQCAGMKEIIGTLEVKEKDGNYALSVVSRFGIRHSLHEFIPQCLINKKVRAGWDGKSLIIEELK